MKSYTPYVIHDVFHDCIHYVLTNYKLHLQGFA